MTDRTLQELRTDKDIPKASVDAIARLQLVNELEPAVHHTDLIIEAVPENFELKKELFAQADLFCSEETILASNTSSLSITKLASNVERRDRFVGLHFFNPPHAMKLIEIVRGERTSDETVARVRAVAEKMGKEPIVVRDSPGFATSRLGVAIGLEAIRMLEQGFASREDIDLGMMLGTSYPMGPFTLLDFVGLDTTLYIADVLFDEFKDSRFAAPTLLRQMVAAGYLGRKTGRGFYNYAAGEQPPSNR